MSKKKTELEKLDAKAESFIKYFNAQAMNDELPIEVRCNAFYIVTPLLQLRLEILKSK